MTVTEAPTRPRPRDAGRASPLSLWRLLWLDLRRNAMPWMFPLLAALFVFDPFRTAMDYPPLWDLRASVVVNKLLPDFVAFVAGVAAWMGSRDSRRHTADLVTATARPRWSAWLITWAATACWAVILYLCGVAVIYGVTATRATWGGPLWWPVAVGCAELAVICALGFAAGALFPSRFTAPLAAVGDPERATGRWLPYLRLGTAVGLTAAAFGVLRAGAAAEQLPGGTLDILRNTAGLTGIGLLLAAVIGGALAWAGPMAYMIVTLFALSWGWTTPWLWPARPPHDLGGALCAGLVFAARKLGSVSGRSPWPWVASGRTTR
jgi:hypothetical protein